MATLSPIWPSSRAVFPEGDPVFISDQQYVIDYLKGKGIDTVHLDKVGESTPDHVVFFGCDFDRLPLESLRDRFASSRVLWVPLAAFDPSPAAARYSVDLFLRTDLVTSTATNRKWLNVLRKLQRPLRIGDDRTSVVFRLGAGAAYSVGRSDPVIRPGADRQWSSIGEYLEVDISRIPAPGSTESSYSVDGVFCARGLCVAHVGGQPHNSPRLQHARELALRVANAGGVLARIDNTHLVSAICDGDEISTELIACAGTSGPDVIEFSFGTNHNITDHIDWNINSQLNEGAQGVHFGIGDGISGAHIDFVHPGARTSMDVD
jgi:hypothetical protein